MSFMSIDIDQSRLQKLKMRFGFRKQQRIREVITQQNAGAALVLVEEVKKNITALGMVDTGEYRDSWSVGITEAGVTVGTKRPDARRKEYGFSGRDSLGRLYHDPAKPHLRPAMIKVRRELVKGLSLSMRKALDEE